MQIRVDEKGGSRVAVVEELDSCVDSVADALDLMPVVWDLECGKLLLPKELLAERFFELRNGMAGEILQKYTNYRLRLAIVGDFSGYTSKSLRDFIYESNQGEWVFFLPDQETALAALHAVGNDA